MNILNSSLKISRTANPILQDKIKRFLLRKIDAVVGRVVGDLDEVLRALSLRPFMLYLELTNLCNANCIFCPYQYQERKIEFMNDEVFYKAVSDYLDIQGGSVNLTPIVGDPLVDPNFLARVHYLRKQPAIDRILVTTNGILLDKIGVRELLTSGITAINISVASFEPENYKQIYRSSSYVRMRNNVTELVEMNARLGKPVRIVICLRSDRSLDEIIKDADFQPILRHHPEIDFTWSFTSAGKRITQQSLPVGMRLRQIRAKKEPCGYLYNGCIVLPNGDVMACPCVGAMDALADLRIGNLREQDLLQIYAGLLMQQIRAQFQPDGKLNETCANCDMYRDLELCRTREGRIRADINKKRYMGETVRRADKSREVFSCG